MVVKKKQGLTREEAKAQTRAKILQATVQTLVEEGGAGFSINKVAKRAGIAQPSFYVHFDNLEELFEAVTQDVLDRYIEPMQTTLKTMLQDLEPQQVDSVLENLFLLAFDVIKDQEGLVRMAWAEREQTKSLFSYHLRRVDELLIESWGAVFIDIGLIADKERGGLRLRLFMDGVLALLERYVTRWLDGDYEDERPLAKALTQYVLSFWQEEVAQFYEQ
ncbi:MAG: TetR/AcrR family transcriptional regulator [Pseudomonadales bacterium]|nr:TetR/AcrR family transcriptional regulator [Pseudomonadales bacterium]